MKIYIIGPVGSGKTTLSKKLSIKYNIKSYELDKVAWDDDNGNIKRNDEEIAKIFNQILETDSWIIEDVGRSKFKKGREEANTIYYIKLSKFSAYLRVTKRWIKQKFGREMYNAKPTLKQLFYYYSTVKSYYKKENIKLKELEYYKEKLVYLNKKQIKEMIK